MAIYIRKVVKSKWNWDTKVISGSEALKSGTDGVTNCCRTSNNTISLWMVDSVSLVSDNDKKVVATLASNAGNLSFIDYVIISDSELESQALGLQSHPGDGFIDEIKDLHYNIVDLDITSISRLGLLINKKVSGEESEDGQNVSDPSVVRIAVNTVANYISTFIPPGSVGAHKLSLKPGFKDFYA